MIKYWKPQSADKDRGTLRNCESGNLLNPTRFKHLPLQQQRQILPIYSYRTQILYTLEKYRTLVLIGETGCGKSTQLPLYLHEAGWTAGNRCVVCTQPRRVAATSVASRVAEEFGCPIGSEVGYGVRFDFKCSPHTVIKYYTDGVLLRETMSDPLLSKYSVIIVDEAHVRSLNSDILLGLLKKIQRKRPDLRLVVTSATMDAVSLKNFFETNEVATDTSKDTAYVLSVQGRQFPVDILYLHEPVRDYIRSCVDTVLAIHRNEDWGDVLVFLPGGEEIDTAIALLNEEYQGDTMFYLPLYSALPAHAQIKVFDPTPPNTRKVVLATNIAEASITIDGVRFVVDSGFVKLNFFDVRSGLDALITCPTSRASATQRAGRAGRTQSGKCFRLMREVDFISDGYSSGAGAGASSSTKSKSVGGLMDFTPPEMQRTDISPAVLQLKALGIDDVLHFDFLSPPPVDSMVFALELLYSLHALDDQCRITAMGTAMAEMPVDPRIAHMLLRSFDFGCGEEALSIAAMCSVEYPFINIRSRGGSGSASEARDKLQKDSESFVVQHSDHLTLLRIYQSFVESGCNQSWCDSISLQYKILHRAHEIRKNLRSVLLRCRRLVVQQQQQQHRQSSSSSSSQVGITSSSSSTSADTGCAGSGGDDGGGEVVLASCGEDYISLRKCLVAGFFSHAARLGHDGQYHTLRGRVTVAPHPQSVVAKHGAPPEWVVYNEVQLSKDNPLLREVTYIDPRWLDEIAPHYYVLNF